MLRLARRGRWTRPEAVSITAELWPLQVSRDAARDTARDMVEAKAQVAQLVEHVTENHGVAGSIPALGTMLFKTLVDPKHLWSFPCGSFAGTGYALSCTVMHFSSERRAING